MSVNNINASRVSNFIFKLCISVSRKGFILMATNALIARIAIPNMFLSIFRLKIWVIIDRKHFSYNIIISQKNLFRKYPVVSKSNAFFFLKNSCFCMLFFVVITTLKGNKISEMATVGNNNTNKKNKWVEEKHGVYGGIVKIDFSSVICWQEIRGNRESRRDGKKKKKFRRKICLVLWTWGSLWVEKNSIDILSRIMRKGKKYDDMQRRYISGISYSNEIFKCINRNAKTFQKTKDGEIRKE